MSGIVLERLETLMRERGYGPGELAYQSGLSYNYIWKIRKGNAPNIAAAQVQKLAKALRTTPDYLIGQTNVSTPGSTSTDASVARPALAPEVTELARRIGELPEALRGVVVRICEGILGLTEMAGGESEPAEELDEESERLIWLLDNLPPERREYWQALIEGEAARLTDHGAGPSVANGDEAAGVA